MKICLLTRMFFVYALIAPYSLTSNVCELEPPALEELELQHEQFVQSYATFIAALQSSIDYIQTSLDALDHSFEQLDSNLEAITGEKGDDPPWVVYATHTSPSVPIILHEGVYCAAKSRNDLIAYFPLEKGDHNMWYADDGSLWGYNKQSRLFHKHLTSTT